MSAATSDLKVSLVAPIVGDEEVEAVVRVLRSGQLAQGPVVAAFEAEFASFVGARHAVAVNSGTAAVHSGLAALGIEDGDEVLTTPFTFAATATPILMQRGRVRFVDIDEQTFNADIKTYAAALTSNTRAVIGVDIFGLPFDRTGIDGLRSKGVKVLEDACQAVGAKRDGVAAGADCDAAGFSFYATKNLMMGEGGVMTTNDDGVAEAARRFRQHGMTAQYEYTNLGYNYRLTDVLAAFGLAQMQRAREITNRRRANAAFYDEALASVPGIRTPFVPANVEHCYHQYSILIDAAQTPNKRGRDEVRKELAAAGVGSGIYYPKPLHLHPLFAQGGKPGEFPVAERVASQILALPIHPGLTESELERVTSVLKSAVGL